MIDSAAPTRVAARSNWPRSVAIDARPADRERRRELVAGPCLDLQRLAGERLGGVELAELAFDHAQVGGLGRDQELVVGLADEREPLGHPAAGLEQVARELGADAEQVERIGATTFVVGGVAHCERLCGEPPCLGHVRPERHAGETAKRLGRQRRVVEPSPGLEGLAEQLRCARVVPHPERHHAGVRERPCREGGRHRRVPRALARTRPRPRRSAAW